MNLVEKGSDRYVCIVAGGYPSEKYVRHSLFEWDWAKATANAGVKVVYAAVDLRSIRRKRPWGIEHFMKEGIEVYAINVPLGPFAPEICEGVGTIAFRLLFQKIMKEQGKPTIIHSHFLTPSVIAASICKKEGIPFVVTEHSSSLDKDEISLSDYKRARKVYDLAVGRIAVSRSFCRRLKKNTGYDFAVIHNMVDLEAFPYQPKQETGKYIFAVTGNLIPSKRHALLLRVLKRITIKYTDIQLWVFGDGAERRKLQEQIKSLKIEEKVQMFGNVERHIIGKEYAYVDAFVLPSEHETFGVAYIEAMAVGIPVIATKCGGPEDFVNPMVGLMIEVDDEDSLFKAMEYMILHKEEYDRKAISDYAGKMFEPQQIAKEIIHVYDGVLKADE